MPRIVGALAWWLWLATAATADTVAWTPDAWTRLDTLELVTQDPGEDAYAFPVWLAVLDGQVYVRLGGRAAGRVQRNADTPYIGVKIGGTRFPRVRCEPAPDQAARVAGAMADKYRSDVLVRHVPHPLTCRLVPE